MVSTRNAEYRYITVNDSDLDALLRGEKVGGMVADDLLRLAQLPVGETGVLLTVEGNPDEPVRPLALVAGDKDIRPPLRAIRTNSHRAVTSHGLVSLADTEHTPEPRRHHA